MAILSTIEVYALARRAGFSAGGEEAVIATAIALAESGGNPDAHNTTPPDDSYGLWQINMFEDLGPERRRQFGIDRDEELFDPLTNARAARSVFTTPPGGFKAWSTFKHGRHTEHLDGVRQAARQFEETGQRGVPAIEEVDLSADQLRQVIREEVADELDSQARKVHGITSWERYLEVLLEAARRN
jgi:hypothetical protein